jgi:hypothetical protein
VIAEVVDCPVVTDLFASRSLSGYFQRLHRCAQLAHADSFFFRVFVVCVRSDFSDVARSTAARFQFEKVRSSSSAVL